MKEYKPQTTPEERANFLRELRGTVPPERLQLACDIVLDLERAEILLRRPTYAPKTTPIHRAELYTVIRQAGSGSAVDLLREVLQDLDMAEAALRGGGR